MQRNLMKIFLSFVILLVGCWRYHPPENLRLLLEIKKYTLYCPVWSPTGKIYFLKDTALGEDLGGPLWVCDTSGEDARLLLDGRYGSLDVSNDGSKLALTCGFLFNEGDGVKSKYFTLG